jgi:hypothetical protein
MKRTTTGTIGKRIKVNEGEVVSFESMPTLDEWFKSLPSKNDRVHTWSVSKKEIQSLLDQQRKELLEKIRLEKFSKQDLEYESDRGYWNGYNDAADDLEELKKNL